MATLSYSHSMVTSYNGTTGRILTLCEGNPSVTGGFPSQRASNASSNVLFDGSVNDRLKKKKNNRVAGDLARHEVHCDVTVVMSLSE